MTNAPQDLADAANNPRDLTLQRRNLSGACLAHAVHDGYTDQLYALLPIWQADYGLSYAGLAFVRALYSVTMGALQVPADRIAARLSPRVALAASTAVSAAGLLLAALPLGFAGLCAGLIVAGIGASVQHPRASLLVADSFGARARGPLGVYNFAGDLGKATFPAAVALATPVFAWRPVVGFTALIGLIVAAALLALLPDRRAEPSAREKKAAGGDGRGFGLLVAIGALDTATRMGYLLFLPFLLGAQNGGTQNGGAPTVALGLALVFAGGAFGKALCGWLGERFGVVGSVIVTEAATALLILTTLIAPLWLALVVLPFLGIVLNGTSSVLYGTVPELARNDEVGRAFAWFYTGVIGSGGLAPILYGAIADGWSRTAAIVAAACTAAAIIPMVIALRPFLRSGQE
ncbi:MFS family permease [Rhodoblastus acidophilus]|uniref:MFS transporter n=1 Tax=Rhodoblastus acidophilus TaxID=1074 RepID=UPI002224246D|nr:MFS transporter [Rhodoblastus acidophilus]MCW2284804.1 MFS family permease [Rhodoblastus acidophilus]MCW2333757.1 MFS family permease [Rhodoblastus acidophilus]